MVATRKAIRLIPEAHDRPELSSNVRPAGGDAGTAELEGPGFDPDPDPDVAMSPSAVGPCMVLVIAAPMPPVQSERHGATSLRADATWTTAKTRVRRSPKSQDECVLPSVGRFSWLRRYVPGLPPGCSRPSPGIVGGGRGGVAPRGGP
jgi:hypothetical protein